MIPQETSAGKIVSIVTTRGIMMILLNGGLKTISAGVHLLRDLPISTSIGRRPCEIITKDSALVAVTVTDLGRSVRLGNLLRMLLGALQTTPLLSEWKKPRSSFYKGFKPDCCKQIQFRRYTLLCNITKK